MKIFKNVSRETVYQNVEKFWDFSKIIPIPKEIIYCPICQFNKINKNVRDFEDTLHIKDITYFTKIKKSNTNYRVDVRFKCTKCSYVHTFGVAIRRKYFLPHYEGYLGEDRKQFRWREIREIINKDLSTDKLKQFNKY